MQIKHYNWTHYTVHTTVLHIIKQNEHKIDTNCERWTLFQGHRTGGATLSQPHPTLLCPLYVSFSIAGWLKPSLRSSPLVQFPVG